MNLPDIRTLTGPVQAAWLTQLIGAMPRNTWICEVGAYYGFLTVVMANAMQGDERLVQIDHHLGGYCDYEYGSKCVYLDVINNLVANAVWNKIIPLPMRSLDAIGILEIMKARFGLIYLDGDHSEECVFMELDRLSKLLVPGGFLCGDDCAPRDMTFNAAWQSGRGDQFWYMHPNPVRGVALAVWRFFRENQDFEVLPDVIGNAFGFRKLQTK